MKRLNGFLVALFLVVGISQVQGAALSLETADYSTVYAEIEAKAKQYGTQQVLVVFDIDNTLLVNKQDLGTDQWFEWQKGLIENKQPFAVASTFQGLIDVQTMLYSLGGMRETEPAVSDYVAQIQGQGLKTIVLTARDGNNRDATLRELSANGLKFQTSAIGPQGGFAGRYLPYELSALEKEKISPAEAAAWKLKTPRPVVYTEGVYMVSGQHKGAMLRLLLNKVGREFEAIVFVDDKAKNTSDMTAGFGHLDLDLTTIRYTREDANVARFESGSKAPVVRQWNALSSVLQNVFGGANEANDLAASF